MQHVRISRSLSRTILVALFGMVVCSAAWAFETYRVVAGIKLGNPIHELIITQPALQADAFSFNLSSGAAVTFSPEALVKIEDANQEADHKYENEPKVHFDWDEFIEGNKWVQRKRAEIVGLAAEGGTIEFGVAREKLGFALHAVQDFYAHSTWVDSMPSDESLAPLGRFFEPAPENFFKTSEQIGSTCGFFGPTVSLGPGSPLFSGHYSGGFGVVEELSTLDWSISVNYPSGDQEKCVHGSHAFGAAGVNKDNTLRGTGYPKARDRAIRATRQFVNDVLSDLANQSSANGPDKAICGLLDAKCDELRPPTQKKDPSLIIGGLKNATALTMIGDNLYFGELDKPTGTDINTGTFSRVSKGGAKVLLATGTANFGRGVWSGVAFVDATPTHIYFGHGDYDTTRIEEMTLAGTNRRSLINIGGGGLAGALKTAAGTDIYFVQDFSGIRKLRVGASAPTNFMPSRLWPRNYVRDGANLYFVAVFSNGLYRINLSTGGAPTLLINGNAQEGQVYVNATNVFVAWPGTVKRIPKAGGAVVTIPVSGDGFMRAADSQYIYFSSTDRKKILRKPIAGGSEQVLVEDTVVNSGIFFNGGKMYWLDIGLGPTAGRIRVLTVPK